MHLASLGTRVVSLLALGASGCAIFAGSYAVPSTIYLFVPAGRVGGGEGTTSEAARARLVEAARGAQIAAANDAIAAARAHPAELRLARRAAAMVREVPAADRAALAGVDALFALLETQPCPGLADLAATHVALGDAARGGDSYLRAARTCDSVEAAIAAWPRVDGAQPGAALKIMDAVAACSDAVTLRRNLAFVPAAMFEDYLAVLAEREARHRDALRRAEAYARARAAEDRARAAASHCASECSASAAACRTSCGADASCASSCDSLYHACNAGCGGF